MENIIKEFDEFYNKKNNEILTEYNKLEVIINNSNNTIELLVEENNLLKKKNNEMIEEKKLKSSSTIWESTQTQLKEKDLIIEQLKKDVEFYKRQCNKSNVTEKYPYNSNNNVENIKTMKSINESSNNKHISNISQEISQEIKQEVKQEIEVIEIIKSTECDEKLNEFGEVIVSKKKKDKLKNGSEKKKKKKDKKERSINTNETDDIEKIEKEFEEDIEKILTNLN